jgi:ABC-type amino acid transport substrate-binding protein
MNFLLFIFLFIFNIWGHSAPVNVGILKFAPPFSSLAGDGNHYYGFIIDMMGSICKRINEQCNYKAINADQQFADLEDGIIDISFVPIPITPDPSGVFIYSLPYLASKGQFLTLEQNKINTLADIKNFKIGVLKDTLYPLLMESKFAIDNTIKNYDKFTDLFTVLASKEVDVIYVNATVGKYIINNDLSQFKLVGDPITMGEGYGILAHKKNADLIKKINSALLDLEADGTYITIYKRYFSN